MGEFKMPSLGADMEKGTLVAWNVKEGDHINRGDIVAIVETEKGAFDTECYEEGVIDRLLVQPGTKVPVGTVLAVIRSAVEAPTEATPAIEPPAKGKAPGISEFETPQVLRVPLPSVRASPLARKVAAALGVDLTAVQGSGPAGVIEKADVEKAAASQRAPAVAAPKALADRAPAQFQAGMRRAIAAAMSKSNREIPHYYLQSSIDMTASLTWVREQNAHRPIRERILPAVLTLQAVARALRDVPALNGFWINDQFHASESIHIGFAIAIRGGGLVTPAIHDADTKSLDELMAALRDVIDRTREGRLRASEMSDPTITLTNLGDLGVESVLGVIYPPQVALVGLGRITEQPWAENGMLGTRQVLRASLAGDHRATDGHVGAQFLDALKRHLQDPAKPWTPPNSRTTSSKA